MIQLLFNGQTAIFFLLLLTIIFALAFHEFGHAYSAKLYGDDTAEKLGRLTLNPIAHIDPIGLLMIIMVGFGWAKPVPTNPANYSSFWATLVVAAAGPFANLVLAFLAVNIFSLAAANGLAFTQNESAMLAFYWFAFLNLLLMLFNLIPIGPLDGHYILPYFLPRAIAQRYRVLNQQYGGYAVLGLIVLSYLGLPVFDALRDAANWMMGALRILG